MKNQTSIYKRTLSVLLAVVLLFSACVCSFTGSVSAAGAVTDLSKSTAANWSTALAGKISDVDSTLYSRYGGNVMKQDTCAYQRFTTQVALQPSTTYRLRFSVMSNAMNLMQVFEVESGVTPEFKNSSATNAATTKNLCYTKADLYEGADGTTWKDFDITFTTSQSTGRDYYINLRSGACNGEGQTNVAYYSDFSLVKVTANANNLLENVQASSFTLSQYIKLANSNNSRYGGTGFYGTTVSFQAMYTKVNLEANTTYKLSYSAKTNAMNRVEYFAVASGETPALSNGTMAEVSSVVSGEYANFDNVITGNGESAWKDVVVTFTTGAATNVDRYLNFRFGSCSDDGLTNSAYLSDFSLVKVSNDTNNLMANYTVTNFGKQYNDMVLSNISHSANGGNAIELSHKTSWRNLYTKLALEPNTKYNLTFYVKAANVFRLNYVEWTSGKDFVLKNGLDTSRDGYVRHTPLISANTTYSETEWTKLTYSFTTSADTNVDRYLQIHFGDCATVSGFSETAYLSDFSLVKATDTNNEMADYTANNWASPAEQYTWFKKEASTESKNGGAAVKITAPSYQNLYTTVTLEPNSTYTLKFYVKAANLMRLTYAELTTGSSLTFANGGLVDTTATNVKHFKELTTSSTPKLPQTSESEWTEITFTFSTSSETNVTRYFNIHYGQCNDKTLNHTNISYLSDFSLVKTGSAAVAYTAKAEGNGAAKVTEDKTAGTITFTATPYQSDSFTGWYNAAGNKVSEMATYTMNVADYQILTAKFTGTNLMSSSAAGTWKTQFTDQKLTAETDSACGGNAMKLTLASWRNLYTKLALEPDCTYSLSFYIKANAIFKAYYTELTPGTSLPYGKNNILTGDAENVLNNNFVINKTTNYSSTEWKKVTVSFSTSSTTEVDYYFGIHFGDCSATSNVALLSDFSLVKTAINYRAASEGNGAAKVTENKAAGTLTFTANPYQKDVFEGWYNAAGNKVSEMATYTMNVADYQILTAKFTGTNLMKDHTAKDWDGRYWNSRDNGQISTTTESHYGGNALKNGICSYQNLFTKIPVQSASSYKLSFSAKVNELYVLYVFALPAGTPTSVLTTKTNEYWNANGGTLDITAVEYSESFWDVKEMEFGESTWKNVEIKFTLPQQDNVDWYFAIHYGNTAKDANGKTISNTAYLSDFSLTKVKPGYMEETTLSYCETYYNTLPKTTANSGTVTGKTVIEIPFNTGKVHTFGATLTGNGKATLAFERNGENVIKELSVNGKRNGFTVLSQPNDGAKAYLILEPQGSITYKDIYCFVSKSVSTVMDMGYEENPNLVKTPTYLSAEEVEYLTLHDEAASSTTGTSNTESSPATGDSSNLVPAATVLLSAAALLFVLQLKKSTKHRSKEVQ